MNKTLKLKNFVNIDCFVQQWLETELIPVLRVGFKMMLKVKDKSYSLIQLAS